MGTLQRPLYSRPGSDLVAACATDFTDSFLKTLKCVFYTFQANMIYKYISSAKFCYLLNRMCIFLYVIWRSTYENINTRTSTASLDVDIRNVGLNWSAARIIYCIYKPITLFNELIPIYHLGESRFYLANFILNFKK